MTKDYYKILDIPEFSTQEEIKRAYRKLARKWHPDVAGNSSETISMFKQINEAYEILSNSAKKADYDNARKFYNYAKDKKETREETKSTATTKPNFKETNSSKNPNHEKKSSFSFNWEEFLAKKCRANSFKKDEEKAPKKGNDINTDVEISVFEAINGTTKVINMLQTQVCPKCGGRKFGNGTTCSKCRGTGEVSEYKRFSVKIPAGIKDNSKIRLAEEGEKGVNGGKNGDLYITVHILEPKNYKTDGLNILKTLCLQPYEAVLGAEVSVPTINGNVIVRIPQNTQNGQKIRLNGCGIKSDSKIGDMILTVEIQLPKFLTQDEIELYKKLRDVSSSNVRS